MVDELEKYLDGFLGKSSRVRCFAHVLNITVKVRKSNDSLLRILTMFAFLVHFIGILQRQEQVNG